MRARCPYCLINPETVRTPDNVLRAGRFWRKSDGRFIQRFRCGTCTRYFSHATWNECFRQKKRKLNSLIFEQLASGLSHRRIAILLNIHRTTVTRKFLFLGKKSADELKAANKGYEPAIVIEFDDMETHEHTHLKPLSITQAVEAHTRRILAVQVSQMPMKGKTAAISRRKYGPRKDLRAKGRAEVFRQLQNLVVPTVLIKSDQNPHYPKDVKRFFPHATHQAFLSRRAATEGQGELKKKGFDPLFTFNHTAAMNRENINRLKRRTWCTTKKAERLQLHLNIYALWHNETYLKLIEKRKKRA